MKPRHFVPCEEIYISLPAVCAKLGVNVDTVRMRLLSAWPLEAALTKPIRGYRQPVNYDGPGLPVRTTPIFKEAAPTPSSQPPRAVVRFTPAELERWSKRNV